MRIVVAGATGLIGRALTRRLLARGDEVTGLSRDPARARALLPPGAEVAGWDASDPERVRPVLAGHDAVVNLAGEPVLARRWRKGVKRQIRRSRIEGTRTIVAAMRGARPAPGTLVNGSAIDYYGPAAGEVAEDGAPGESFLGRLCADWEAEAFRARELGTRVVTIRTGLVLARGGGALAKMVPPFRFFAGGRLGHGRQPMSWIHIEDLTGLFLLALDREGLEGPLNGTAPNPVPNAQFAKALGRALGRPSWIPAPGLLVRLLVGEGATLVLRGNRVVPARALAEGYSFRFPDLDGALEDLLGPDAG